MGRNSQDCRRLARDVEDTDRLPLGVVANWRSSVQWMGTNRRIEEVVILKYERLGKIFEAKPRKGAKKLSKRELARRGAASEEFDIVLFDESHALKNLTSLRAKFSVKLYRSAKMIFWLSATAGQNPLELGYLARVPTQAEKAKSPRATDGVASSAGSTVAVRELCSEN